MIESAVNAYEELKKYVYIIHRKKLSPIIVIFQDNQFFHLAGLQHLKIDSYFPPSVKTAKSKYEYIKKYPNRFEKAVNKEIKRKQTLYFRITTIDQIMNIFYAQDTKLYNLKEKMPGSVYNGDYGLNNTFGQLHFLLGLKLDDNGEFNPQTWMVNNRPLFELKGRPVKNYERIEIILKNDYYTLINGQPSL